jgi:hypothetical protein
VSSSSSARPRPGERHLDRALDGGERGAQLVAGVGGEAAQRADRPLQPHQHPVEGLRQVPQLRRPLRLQDPSREPADLDLRVASTSRCSGYSSRSSSARPPSAAAIAVIGIRRSAISRKACRARVSTSSLRATKISITSPVARRVCRAASRRAPGPGGRSPRRTDTRDVRRHRELLHRLRRLPERGTPGALQRLLQQQVGHGGEDAERDHQHQGVPEDDLAPQRGRAPPAAHRSAPSAIRSM